MKDAKWLTVVRATEWLSVEPGAVRHWLRTGKMNGMKLPGGEWRVRPEDVEAMLKSPVKVGDAIEA